MSYKKLIPNIYLKDEKHMQMKIKRAFRRW